MESKTIKPTAGLAIACRCVAVIRGTSRPPEELVISTVALASGVVVPIPIPWAFSPGSTQVVRKQNAMVIFFIMVYVISLVFTCNRFIKGSLDTIGALEIDHRDAEPHA